MLKDIKRFQENLLRETESLGILISPRQLDAFRAHFELLRKWNPRIRLVGTIEPARAAIELFADSIIACRFTETFIDEETTRDPLRLIDIGSGAGFPGIPIAVMRQQWQATLVESNAKKVSFIKNIRRTLALSNTEVIRARSEELACGDDFRQKFDLAFCRALAAPEIACELTLPFLRVGGSFVGQTAVPDIDKSRSDKLEPIRDAAMRFGASLETTMSYSLSGTPHDRLLIRIKKLKPTQPSMSGAPRTIEKKAPA